MRPYDGTRCFDCDSDFTTDADGPVVCAKCKADIAWLDEPLTPEERKAVEAADAAPLASASVRATQPASKVPPKG